MLESEARTKWCPMSRVFLDYSDETGNSMTAANRGLSPNAVSDRCIGSACMMLRKLEKPFEKEVYCGLAGKP